MPKDHLIETYLPGDCTGGAEREQPNLRGKGDRRHAGNIGLTAYRRGKPHQQTPRALGPFLWPRKGGRPEAALTLWFSYFSQGGCAVLRDCHEALLF